MRQNLSATQTNDFVISLKQPLTLTNSNNYFKVGVQQAVIPHNIKQINPLNSTLAFTFIRNVTNYNGSVTLTTGNYNILTLLEELRSKLVVAILALSSVSPTLAFTYDK